MEKLSFFDRYVKSGDYSNGGSFTCLEMIFPELAGKTWGIIGLGNIGRRVADIAKAFGANVIYYSTSGKNKKAKELGIPILSEDDFLAMIQL